MTDHTLRSLGSTAADSGAVKKREKQSRRATAKT